MATISKPSSSRSGSKNAKRARNTKADAILSSRKTLLEEYSKKMKLADQQASDIARRLTSQIRWISWSALAATLLAFLSAISLTIYGFWKLLEAGNTANTLFPMTCLGVGLIILALIFLRNPFDSLEKIVQGAARMNLVHLGLLRQMGQLDLAFHDLYSWNVEISTSKINDMLISLQRVMDNAASILPELDDLES